MLDDRLKQSLAETHKTLLQQRSLPSPERLAECFSLFRARFGPAVLKKLEGDELLKLMHARPSKDSLMYWLEFKNDDEFPSRHVFGSIAGGSALKFGLFWREKTSSWVSGSAQNQTVVSAEAAATLAAKQRDQLLAAAELLERFPESAPDAGYLELQKQMDRLAPDVSPYSWGHKYLSLLYPTKLDDYHNREYQRFYLIKLLQKPPPQQGLGLYVAAGRFVQIASELGMPINHLTTILNERNPKPHAYWRIGTSLGERESIWELMKTGNSVAIGWAELGNLAETPEGQDLRDTIRQRLEKEMAPNVASRKAGEVRNFVEGISDGDLVLAADGGRILGIGRITGPYRFDPAGQEDAPHRRPVGWLSLETWDLPETEGLRTTVVELSEVQNLLETERRLLAPVRLVPLGSPTKETTAVQGAETIPLALNTILYGPPGTGKTYRLRNQYMEMFTDRQALPTPEEQATAVVKDLSWWQVVAIALLDSPENRSTVARIFDHPLVRARMKLSANQTPRAMLWFTLQTHTKTDCPNVNTARRFDPLLFFKDENSVWSIDAQLADNEAPELRETLTAFHEPPKAAPEIRRYRFTSFHQSLSYEDFIEGIKPRADEAQGRNDAQISYEVTLGIFREICREAEANPTKNYALFIDEINRGNVASIFGELITLIEEDKRLGKENQLKTILPYSRDEFGVPRNLYIIGTMNTADRSVEALDTALRRRFTFEEMRPDAGKIIQPPGLQVDLRKLFETINARIEQLLDHDHCIGHYYFMGIHGIADLKSRFANRIIPLLREYFYGNPAKIGMVLGETFITARTNKIPFAPGPWGADELDEKGVFTFADVASLTEGDFQAVYAENRPGI